MDTALDFKLCAKSPSQGGWTRTQADEVARQYGLDPIQYRRKEDLCVALQNLLQPPVVGAPTTWTAAGIADQLQQLAKLYQRKGDAYRASAFTKAAEAVRRYQGEVTGPDVFKNLPGVGAGSLERIRELFRRGQLAELEAEANIRKELELVYGIGPATANKLMDLGVTSLEDLRQKVEAGLIDLTAHQKMGLEHVEDFKQRIPRQEVKHFGDYVVTVIQHLAPNNQAEIVGSYRRGKADSGDVDIVFTGTNNLAEIVTALQQIGLLNHIFAQGDVSLHATYWNGYPYPMGILRKIDIRYVPPESWPTALLHSTGSDRFNVDLRNVALSKNLTLSEHGLFQYNPVTKVKGDRVPVTSEADIFTVLGLAYVPPEQRNL